MVGYATRSANPWASINWISLNASLAQIVVKFISGDKQSAFNRNEGMT